MGQTRTTKRKGRGEDRKKRGRAMGNINKASKKNSKRKQVRTYLTAFSLESEFKLLIYVGSCVVEYF